MGIEPTSRAWEAFILPLNYTRRIQQFYDGSGNYSTINPPPQPYPMLWQQSQCDLIGISLTDANVN